MKASPPASAPAPPADAPRAVDRQLRRGRAGQQLHGGVGVLELARRRSSPAARRTGRRSSAMCAGGPPNPTTPIRAHSAHDLAQPVPPPSGGRSYQAGRSAVGRSMSDLQQDTTDLLAAAHPPQHGQPAGRRARAQEDAGRRCCATPASRSSCVGRTPERPNLVARLRGARRRPGARAALARRHRPGRPRRVAARPLVGRPRRRRGLGPRRAGHEVARPRPRSPRRSTWPREGWRPARGDLLVIVVVDEETGGERRRDLAEREPPRPRALRLCCSTRAPARSSRTAASALYGVCIGREGRLPLHADHATARRATPRCPGSATTRCPSSRRCSRRWAPAAPALDITDAPARAARARSASTATSRRALEACAQRDPRLAALVEPMLG